jgi:hypothetical protein
VISTDAANEVLLQSMGTFAVLGATRQAHFWAVLVVVHVTQHPAWRGVSGTSGGNINL